MSSVRKLREALASVGDSSRFVTAGQARAGAAPAWRSAGPGRIPVTAAAAKRLIAHATAAHDALTAIATSNRDERPIDPEIAIGVIARWHEGKQILLQLDRANTVRNFHAKERLRAVLHCPGLVLLCR